MNDFSKAYDELFLSLNNQVPEDTDWFFPALLKLIEKHGHPLVCKFVAADPMAAYHTALCIKAGLKGVSKATLLQYAQSSDEDEIYDGAFGLAAYGHPEGFDLLYKIATFQHPAVMNYSPQEVLLDLEFIKGNEADKLRGLIEGSIEK